MTNLTIRDVDSAVIEGLKATAAGRGQSLSALVRDILTDYERSQAPGDMRDLLKRFQVTITDEEWQEHLQASRKFEEETDWS